MNSLFSINSILGRRRDVGFVGHKKIAKIRIQEKEGDPGNWQREGLVWSSLG